MAEGRLVLHVWCRVCGHVGAVPQDELVARFGQVLPAEIKPWLRCTGCRARGEVAEVRLGWAGASATQPEPSA